MTIRVFQGERELAADNKILGQFNLEEIPPAPRECLKSKLLLILTQMELYQFLQKTKALEKNKITIQASGGLSDEDIEQMVKDAEDNAEADKERRELMKLKTKRKASYIQLKNQWRIIQTKLILRR